MTVLTWRHLHSIIIILIICEHYSSWISLFNIDKLASGVYTKIGIKLIINIIVDRVTTTAAEAKVSLSIYMSVLRIRPEQV